MNSVTTEFDLDLSTANPTVLFDGARKYLPGAPGAGWEDSGTWYSTLTDLVGSPIKTVSDTGTTSTSIHYDPYGVVRPGSTTPAGIGYTGEWRDPTGLINLRARAYDPLLARFIGRDTFGGVLTAPQTGNRYNYALGNPLRYTDPSGHMVRTVIENPGEVISFAIQVTGPGSVYSAFIAITGYDPIAGRYLTEFERQLAAVSIIPLIGKPMAHGIGIAVEVAAKVSGKLIRALDRVDNVFSALGSKLGATLSRLGHLGEGVSGALRRGSGTIGRHRGLVDDASAVSGARAVRLDARATELAAALNPIRAQGNPIGLASGFDASGRELTFVAQKSGKLDNAVMGRLEPNELPVRTEGIEHAEVQAMQAAIQSGLRDVMAAARPNLVCVPCEVNATTLEVTLASPSRAGRYATEAARLRAILGL